jgi:prophage antirepressor-like protein
MRDLLETGLGESYSRIERVYADGILYYKALDICGLLGLKNTGHSVRGNVRIGYFGIEREDVRQFGHEKSPLYLTESGMFKLILKCRKPLAYAIKVRLSQEVLPQIMRTGEYRNGESHV